MLVERNEGFRRVVAERAVGRAEKPREGETAQADDLGTGPLPSLFRPRDEPPDERAITFLHLFLERDSPVGVALSHREA